MSVQAVKWALNAKNTGPLAAEARLVLLVMADRADKDGRNVYLSASTIAKMLGTTDRSVRRHLSTLRERRLIVPGDPEVIPEHYRHDRRPVVYDLPIHRPTKPETTTPAPPVKLIARTPPEWSEGWAGYSRPDSSVTPWVAYGVTAVSARGDSSVRDGVTAVSSNPVDEAVTNPNARKAHHSLLTQVGRIIGGLDLTAVCNGMMPLRGWGMA